MTRFMPLSTILCRVLGLLMMIGIASSSSHAVDLEDPWSVLGELRDNLAAAYLEAEFVQTYMPAGFSTGDRETGHLYLALPDCVRWDYEEPYPKSFLLCQSTIHTWNPGEQAGRRFQLTDSDEPGIDLLRLQIEDLRRRYDARIEEGAQEGKIAVVLFPLVATSTLVEARISMDSEREVLSSLSYRDLEGNISVFEITGYRPFTPTGQFEPPAELDWLDQ